MSLLSGFSDSKKGLDVNMYNALSLHLQLFFFFFSFHPMQQITCVAHYFLCKFTWCLEEKKVSAGRTKERGRRQESNGVECGME